MKLKTQESEHKAIEITSKSSLAIILSQLEDFSSVNVKLEQYSTPSEIAAEMIWQAGMQGNIVGKSVLDAACGPGFLGLGALLLGATKVFFVDISENALEICKRNYDKLSKLYEIGEAVFILNSIENFNVFVDVVLQNPPFGTKTKHADRLFLDTAFRVSKTIYSIHKITSKKFIDAIAKDHGFKVESVREIEFGLKKTMKHHKKKMHYIECGIWRIVK